MRCLLVFLLACAGTATKTTEHGSAPEALDVVEAIYNVINTVVIDGLAGSDPATDTGINALSGYADILLRLSDVSSHLFEDIELALRLLRTRHDVFRADLDIAIEHARAKAESYFKWLYAGGDRELLCRHPCPFRQNRQKVMTPYPPTPTRFLRFAPSHGLDEPKTTANVDSRDGGFIL